MREKKATPPRQRTASVESISSGSCADSRGTFVRLLGQVFRLGLDLGPEVDGVVRVAAGHHGELAGGVVEEDVGEAVTADDLVDGVAGALVAGGVFVGVDFLQHAVTVADEVEEKEGSRVRIGRLGMRVRLKSAGMYQYQRKVC